MGSPPRVRSRRHRFQRYPYSPRITSACAEQTCSASRFRLNPRDHLRVCGADVVELRSPDGSEGSPPRVRSRRPRARLRDLPRGITSACAEQTCSPGTGSDGTGDHLRVCGADCKCGAGFAQRGGSPPRVRSRQTNTQPTAPCHGITSACAEQTRTPVTPTTRPRDHLRVCGADTYNGFSSP